MRYGDFRLKIMVNDGNESPLRLVLLGLLLLLIAGEVAAARLKGNVMPIPFGRKTVYGNNSASSSPSGWKQFCEKKDRCEVLHLNMLTRHGTRFPSYTEIERFAQLEKQLHDLFQEQQKGPFAWLGKWKSPFRMENGFELIQRGANEMHSLGNRTAALYKDSLKRTEEKYYSDFYRYQFNSTQTRWTVQSANAFGAGLFSVLGGRSKSLPPVMMEARSMDRAMYFFRNCKLYKQRVRNNQTALEEIRKWEQSEHMLGVVHRAEKRLGLQGSLNPDILYAMYLACAFEVAFSNNNRFCQAIFDETLEISEDHHILEYTEDIMSYWQKGPGYDINLNMSALLLWDILDEIKTAKEDGKEIIGQFRFAHAETLIPVMNSLGLFVDNFPLTSDGWEQEAVRNRKFRTSRISPFGANIRLTLLKKNAKEYILLEVNERVERVPGCKKAGLCDYNAFVHHMEEKLTDIFGSIEDGSQKAAKFDLMCQN
eukprot:Nk52_evm10s564 gene=Nk52_evmTU10s564